MKNDKKKKYALLFGSLAAVILYPSLFMYFHNMSEGHFAEIFPSIGKNAILAIGLLLLFAIVLRDAESIFSNIGACDYFSYNIFCEKKSKRSRKYM